MIYTAGGNCPARLFHKGISMSRKRTKFNVDMSQEDRTYDGIVFDSKLEMRYYMDVILPLSRSGDITYYELQKPYALQPKFTYHGKSVRAITYVADFYVEYKDGSAAVIDIKGFADSLAKMKRKIFWYNYPDIEYKWICFSKKDGGWCDYEAVNKRRHHDKILRIKGEKEHEQDN